MIEDSWDQFVIYVNAYYAVQEAYDSARRNWEKPAVGLDAFCHDANPFLWDGKASAEEAVYEDFTQRFMSRFETDVCAPEEGYVFVREWLATQEGDAYGTELVSSFDAITNADEFKHACPQVSRQLAARASRLERTPQDLPDANPEPPAMTPSAAEIDAVIALLAHGDEAFAQELRARLEDGDH